MHRYLLIALINIAFFILAGLAVSYFTVQKDHNTTRRRIIVTSPVIEDILKRIITDSNIEIKLIITPGIEPHDFEPTPQNIIELRNADIVIAIGNGFEPWLNDFKKAQPDSSIYFLADDMTEYLEPNDPHFWLDIDLGLRAVKNIQLRLKDMSITYNSTKLIADLKDINERYTDTLGECSIHRFISLHSAYNYLFNKHGIIGIGLRGVSDEEEITIDKVKQAVESTADATVIFTETDDIPPALRSISSELNVPVFSLNTLEINAKQEDNFYYSKMLENLEIITKALKCRQ